MDGKHVPAFSRVRRRSVQGILRALVRHAQGSSRRQLRDNLPPDTQHVAELLYSRSVRRVRRFPHLRQSMNGRRKFLLSLAGAAGATGLAAGFLQSHRPRPPGPAATVEPPLPPDPAFPNPLRLPGSESMLGMADATGTLTLTAKPVEHAILAGKPVRVLAYEMEQAGRHLLNPVLRTRTGATLRIKLWNALEETSIIHWHGLKVDSNNDGHPHYAIGPGATYDYQFTVANRAATYWYHPHPHHLTGAQIYGGLAGLFIVEDEEDLALKKALDLRFAETDVPLVLQDRRIDENGALVFAPS